MVEADKRVGDDEAALGQIAASPREENRRLQHGRVVVAEVADDGYFEGLGLRQADQLRAGADKRMPSEPAVLDGFQQERAIAFGLVAAQPQVGPEGGEEIGGDDGGCVHGRANKKTFRLEGLSSEAGGMPRSGQATLPPRSLRQVQAQVCVAGDIPLRVRVRRRGRQLRD